MAYMRTSKPLEEKKMTRISKPREAKANKTATPMAKNKVSKHLTNAKTTARKRKEAYVK